MNLEFVVNRIKYNRNKGEEILIVRRRLISEIKGTWDHRTRIQ